MILTTPAESELIKLLCTAKTVIEPGDTLEVAISFMPHGSCTIKEMNFEFPEILRAESNSIMIDTTLEQSEKFDLEMSFFTDPDKEGFGQIFFQSEILDEAGESHSIDWYIWISVFEFANASDESYLPVRLRERLVKVVNYLPRNGHIFLADYVSFFRDFLNIEVPLAIARLLSTEFGLPDEGLPLDPETYLEIILGKKTFYGIDKVELIYEEDCNESDNRFDLVSSPEVNIKDIDHD